ncbi:glycosyltransferase [Pseudonocardia sp. K10HN5]|uniref:Glycosyltransferase n=2 Tax=Pseudonocardia acidicola TaxID=2724939 RepID=A0ABX1S7P3_9PSEU|nr:glycosyltransferase [Pseudonocardia acidicola]NMH97571.1 glycosyltransferase [Pseudonocardia acidicola]
MLLPRRARGRLIRWRRRGSDAPDGSRRVLILTAGVGAGHDGAAYELARRLRRCGVEVDVRDYLDALPAVGRRIVRDCYMPAVQHTPRFFDWLFVSLEHRRWVQLTVLRFCRLSEGVVRRWASGADVVVSTYPLASQTLGRLRAAGLLTVPAVTFLTDPAAHRMWCHPDVDMHLTVTSATVTDGSRYGVALRAAGALAEPRFSRSVLPADRARIRAELGVEGDEPVVLISAGSLGLGLVPDAVDAILRHPRVRVVVLCGRNESLRRRLATQDRVSALGWRDDVPDLMAAADALVHNAGGLSFTEALVAGLPSISYLAIPGHGRANASVLAAAALAPWPSTPDELAAAIDEVVARPRAAPTPMVRPGQPDAAAMILELIGPADAGDSSPAELTDARRVG